MSKTTKEEYVTVIFNGYSVDLFKTENGPLGITVTEQWKSAEDGDAKSVDIFVSPDVQTVTHTAWGNKVVD